MCARSAGCRSWRISWARPSTARRTRRRSGGSTRKRFRSTSAKRPSRRSGDRLRTSVGRATWRRPSAGRPVLNDSNLPGLIHSLGVYRVICLNQTGGPRDALMFHHPAGTCFQTKRTRLFFARYRSTDSRLSRAARLRITRRSNSIRGFPRVNIPNSLSTREVKDFSVHD